MSVNPIPPPPPSECGDIGPDSGMSSPAMTSATVSPSQQTNVTSVSTNDSEDSVVTSLANGTPTVSTQVSGQLSHSSAIAGSRSTLTGTPVPQLNSGAKGNNAGAFTKVLYYFDDVETPYLIKVPSCIEATSAEPSVTLGAFKTVVNKANCKYFVKTMDQELRQTVKEEVMDDNALLPLYNGRIIVYVNSIENSSSHGGGGGSQSGGALSGGESNNHHTNRLSGGAGSGHGGSQGNNQFGNGSDTGSQYNEIGERWNTVRTPASAGNSHIAGHGGRHQGQSYHHMKNPPYKGRFPPAPPPDEDDYTTATDTESFVQQPKGGLRGPPPSAVGRYGQHSRNYYDVDMGGAGYDSAATSQFTTDYDSFVDSTTDDDESIYRLPGPGYGAAGGYYRYPRKMMQGPGRPRRPPRPKRNPGQRGCVAPSMSSITDSCSSLNLQTVIINMDSSKHLGISIVGQSTNDGVGDGGIYVGEITRDGAVYQEGSIDPGDLIIQANDILFTNLSNDDAVKVLRDLAKKPGPLKLVVAKLWNSDPAGFDGDGGFGSPEYYQMEPRTDLPLHPIDPASWVEASRIATLNGTALSPAVTSDEGSEIGNFNYPGNNAMGAPGMGGPNSGKGGDPMSYQNSNLNRQSGGGQGSGGSAPELRDYNSNNSSAAQMANMQPHMMGQHAQTMSSGMMHSSSTGAYPPFANLRTSSDPTLLIAAMMMPDSGLEIKDRMWLKITIPNAFLGRHFVQWLYEKVQGFSSRNEARSFAKRLLKEGYLKHTTGKSTFSEQCYYVFNLDKLNNSSAASSARMQTFRVYQAGTLSTMQSTLDSSQFGAAGGSNLNTSGGGMIDTTTTDNNSSHDGSEENNDQLPPLPGQNPHAPWNLVTPPYSGYIPPPSSAVNYSGPNMYAQQQQQGYSYSMYPQQSNAPMGQSSADFMTSAQIAYSSNMTPMHHHLQHQPPHYTSGGNLSESRLPLLQQMMNNASPGGAQGQQQRKDFSSNQISSSLGNQHHQGANDSIFASVM